MFDPALGDGVVVLRDGRRLAYRTFGVADGMPVVALHGTPGSRLKFSAADPAARRFGMTVIAPDRWGYGETDVHMRPSLAAWARDTEELADHLAIDRFAVVGVSGGGPYATAVAAALGTRVTALAIAAPVGPIHGEADADVSAFHKMCFGPLARRPQAVGHVFRVLRTLLAVSPRLGLGVAMLRTPPADRKVMANSATRGRLAQTFIEGLRPGVVGPITDMGLFGARWDVDPGAVVAVTRVWLGSDDRNVPRSAARRLASRIPDCELIELEGEGHMWVADHYDVVLGWVAEAAGKGGPLRRVD